MSSIGPESIFIRPQVTYGDCNFCVKNDVCINRPTGDDQTVVLTNARQVAYDVDNGNKFTVHTIGECYTAGELTAIDRGTMSPQEISDERRIFGLDFILIPEAASYAAPQAAIREMGRQDHYEED